MNPHPASEALAQVANDYIHNPVPAETLDPLKGSILLLRAKYASYEDITALLASHGAQVPVGTVRKFCRRHHGEVQKLRSGLSRPKNTPPAEPTAAKDSRSKKSRTIRGPV